MNPETGRPGPTPKPGRDGDKLQARQRVNTEVRQGFMPHPNALPCADCGHIWKEGERRHEYDHHLGYAAKNQYDVEAVCTTCHVARDSAKAAQTRCISGHEFTAENTYWKSNGTRACRECMRRWDRERPPRGSEYWRKVNAKRRARGG